ncbi:MAG: hypothetical protein JO131_06010 [Gammaproteobacteria bacterium]|nr:hypothetical protein [Gammaproteobacteria bacterium]
MQAGGSTGGPQVNEILKADWEANATPEQLAEAKKEAAGTGCKLRYLLEENSKHM